MKCLSPIALKSVDDSYFYVPCGQCISCRLNYAKLWSIRMMEELKNHDKACFVTLTYDPEHLPEDNGLHKDHLQKFWKRLRKECKVRYFCCGEHGDRFNRPHYHAIIYGLAPEDKEIIEKHWKNGIVHVGTVTEDSCAYVAKYMTKKLNGRALQEKLEEDPDYQNEFVLMSRRPGIGATPSLAMKKFMYENGFIYRKGLKSSLPRYYKDRFFIETHIKDQDHDEFIKHLTNFENNDNLIRNRLKFFGRK